MKGMKIVPREKNNLAYAHALILEGDETDSFEQAIKFLRECDQKVYEDIKSLVEIHLRGEIFGE